MGNNFQSINISLFEFTKRVIRGGRISLKGIFLLPLYYFQIIPSLIFEFLQLIIYGQRIKKTIILKDPVFILGHYRSGTSFLQKLLVSDKRFGFLTYYDALFPNSNLLFGRKMQPVFQRLINLLKIKNPFFHNTVLQLSEPDEEDDYLMNKASAYTAYWGFVFPRRWHEWLNGSSQFKNQKYCESWKKEYINLIKYATFKNKGKQLVLKSPPNTERISFLVDMFPQAKFIYIYRNPFHLFYSVKNMWESAILKYYSVQKISDEQLDEIVFDHFIYLTEKYEEEKHLIPEKNLIEISYEELKVDSFGIMQKIYSQINLPNFENTTNDLLEQLKVEKNYKNFQYQYNSKTLALISEKWEKYIHRWNYNTPDFEISEE